MPIEAAAQPPKGLAQRSNLDIPAANGTPVIGVRGKIGLLYVALVLVIVGSMVILATSSLTQAFNDQYQDKALAIVRTFEAQYGSIAPMPEPASTQAQTDRLVALISDIYSISVYVLVDGQPQRWASSGKGTLSQVVSDRDTAPISSGRTVFDEHVVNGERLLEVVAPIGGGDKPAAAIEVNLRLDPRDQVVREQAMRVATIGVGAGGLLLLVLYLSMYWLLLKPLVLLQDSVQAISHGHFGRRVLLTRNDEFGELAAAFNAMAHGVEQRELQNRHLQQRLQEQYDEAQARAISDPVTGLYNHRHFHDCLAKEIERGRRFDSAVALLFADIDHFKGINDVYGHQFGDQILREMAHLLRGSVREIDVVARYGGEEFAIILPGADAAAGRQVAERIRRVVASYQFGGEQSALPTVAVSIGVAAYPADALGSEQVIAGADQAMYHAKRLGRNQVRLYSELLAAEDPADVPRAT